ncbi:PREDICTED: exosome complex component RRP42 [Nipponia nippon]|nr:PREDICTED: exosome complex component RRP42 [Nipponia nippon]
MRCTPLGPSSEVKTSAFPRFSCRVYHYASTGVFSQPPSGAFTWAQGGRSAGTAPPVYRECQLLGGGVFREAGCSVGTRPRALRLPPVKAACGGFNGCTPHFARRNGERPRRQEDLRVDGRGCEDYRCAEVETDVVSNTSGSARVKLGHTDILVGVKAEMGTPKLEKPDEGYLEFFVDCSANATPEFEGRGGEELGTEIANTLYRVFSSENSVDLKSLCINPREHCWVLYVDVLLLECGGNLFDAISIAVKAALFNTRIPKVRVLEDEEGSKEIELSDDPYDCIRLNVDDVPCIVTLSKIGYRHVVDATLQEEACSLASLLISVTSKGALTSMKKVGKGSLDPESIFEMMETGKRVGKSLHIALQKILDEEESLGTSRQKVGFLG